MGNPAVEKSFIEVMKDKTENSSQGKVLHQGYEGPNG